MTVMEQARKNEHGIELHQIKDRCFPDRDRVAPARTQVSPRFLDERIRATSSSNSRSHQLTLSDVELGHGQPRGAAADPAAALLGDGRREGERGSDANMRDRYDRGHHARVAAPWRGVRPSVRHGRGCCQMGKSDSDPFLTFDS